MTLGTPNFLHQLQQQQAAQHQIPADIDLEGGTVTSIDESEEIDPTDNCKVFVTRYHILSADGQEESTITKRRKLKVNCTQSLKRIEYTNGKEAKLEEKTMVFNNVDFLRAQTDGNRAALAFNENYPKDGGFNEVLLRTQDTFMTLLHQKRDQLVQMFPDLFTNLRTQPEIFAAPATTYQEVVVNPDGSTTMKTQSSKAFSTHYTREETYVNGVKKDSKCKFRAFIEMRGPDGGFRIHLNDKADEDLSEEENDTDEDSMSLISRLSRSGISEIPDTTSALVKHGSRVPQILSSTEPLKRHDKAWHAVNELVESEERYVQKLNLLEKFRLEVENDKVLDKRQMSSLFANMSSLNKFHSDHLLPQLMDRRREWQTTRRISDVMKKQGPFLKMYSEYTNNYKNATQMFDECSKKKRRFEEIVRKFEKMAECENLALVSHLICPVQRVMRYQLLLKEYQKYLKTSDTDYADTVIALDLVMEAASHANEMMRKVDRYRNVLEIQEQLGNSMSLVSPSRELLKRAKLNKISSSTNKCEERLLIVFNDLILLVSERALGIGGKYKLRAIFDPFLTQICEGDNLEREHSFYLRGADSQSGPSRCVELFCSTQNEKADLIDTIWRVINDVHQRKSSFASSPSSQSLSSVSAEKKCCAKCDVEFVTIVRPSIQCVRCSKRFCKKCFGQQTRKSRFCLECLESHNNMSTYYIGGKDRANVLAVPAAGEDIIKASCVQLRGIGSKPVHRYFVLRKDFCLYSYGSEKDLIASAMLPISGCEIVPSNDRLTFVIRHMHRAYNISVFNESDHAEWMAALILCANAQIPSSKNGIGG